MNNLASSPALTSAISKIEERLKSLRDRHKTMPPKQPSKPFPRDPYDDPTEELEAEIDVIDQILSRLKSVESEDALKRIYEDAASLMTKYREYPVTRGKHEAGVYLTLLLRDTLEALGIAATPAPSPSASPKPSN